MAMQNTNTNATTGPATALWRIVLAEYESARVQFERNWAAFEAADNTAKQEAPRRRDLEATYGLHWAMSREDALIAVDRHIDRRERAGSADAQDFSDEQVDRMAEEAQRIVDEYFTSFDEQIAAQQRHRVHELQQAHFAFVDEIFDPAREKLLATPAPDAAAFIEKAEVLATMYDEAEGLRDDAKRLFRELA